MDGEEVGARRINTSNDEVCADVALIPEEMLLQHCHACYDARLAARREGVELQVGGNEGGRKLRVRSGAGACAPNLGSNVMQLFAVLVFIVSMHLSIYATQLYGEATTHLVCYNRPACCSCVCSNDNASLEETAYDGRAGTCGLGKRHALGMECGIAVVEAEVEATHGDKEG